MRARRTTSRTAAREPGVDDVRVGDVLDHRAIASRRTRPDPVASASPGDDLALEQSPAGAGGRNQSVDGSGGALAHGERGVEGLCGRRDGAVDRGLVVGERDEPGLELRRRRIDTAVEQRAAEAAVGVEVAGRGAREVATG